MNTTLHQWCVYAASYDERRYVWAETWMEAARMAAPAFGVAIGDVIVRYVKTVTALREGSLP